MIRLSQITAFNIFDTKLKNISAEDSNKLYLYQNTTNYITNSLFVQADTSLLRQMSRKYALAPFWKNVLLGTSNFYPEQGLNLEDFHQNSEVTNLTSISDLSLQFKKAKLYFLQGMMTKPDTKGYWLRVFCKLSDGSEITLASVVDFLNDTNILATSSKLYESQIYNESLDIEFIDIEYLINSSDEAVQEFRNFLLSDNIPTTYSIQYSEFTDEGIDNFVENSYSFTSLNFSVINEQSLPITIKEDDLACTLSFSNDGFSLYSTIYHNIYTLESYLKKFKNNDEEFIISHYFNVMSYDSDNQLINQTVHKISNPIDTYSGIHFRPIISTNADHAKVEVTIKIENINTGLTISRSTSIIIEPSNIDKFQPIPSYDFNIIEFGLSTNVIRNVNQITPNNETPDIIQIEKRTYVHPQLLNQIKLYNAKMTVQINTGTDLSTHKRLYLKIGSKIIVANNRDNIRMFDLPQEAYTSNEKQYLLLDENQKMISVGTIIRPTQMTFNQAENSNTFNQAGEASDIITNNNTNTFNTSL